MILLRALLAKNNIDEKDVQIVTIGSDMTPLLTGQVDVVTGWLTNTTALKVLGADRVDLRLWDSGVQLYAYPYYATSDTLRQADMLVRFLRAAVARLGLRLRQPRQGGRAAGQGISPTSSRRRARRRRRDAVLRFNASTKPAGYGTMDPAGLAGSDRHLDAHSASSPSARRSSTR